MINLLFLHIHFFLCIFMVSLILSKVSTDHFTLLKLYFENFWKINDLWIWIASWMSPGVIFDPFHLTKDRTNFKMVWLISVTHWPTRSEITISFINSAGYLDSKVVLHTENPKVSQKWNEYQEILSISWILSRTVGQKFQNISKNSKMTRTVDSIVILAEFLKGHYHTLRYNRFAKCN